MYCPAHNVFFLLKITSGCDIWTDTPEDNIETQMHFSQGIKLASGKIKKNVWE